MILLLLLNLSISSLFGLPATFGNPPSDPACDALRTVADSLTGARIYGSLCADSMPKSECTTASFEVLKKCLDGIHVDQDCLDRMHKNLTEVSMDDQDCFCGGLVKFSEMLTSVKALLCLEEDEVRAGMGSFFWSGTKTKPSTTTKSSTSSSSTSTYKKYRSAAGGIESVPYESTNYEKRFYPSAKYVCTTSTYENPEAHGEKSSMEEANEGEKMFLKLFAYIEGRNSKNQKIEMTSPVFTKMSIEDDSDYIGHQVTKTMCFFIPKKFQGNPPAPNDLDVFIFEMPEMSFFVKTFLGYSSDVTDSVWIYEKESFMREMPAMGVENNHFFTATYDIGWSKHEVMLEIINREKKSYYSYDYYDDNYMPMSSYETTTVSGAGSPARPGSGGGVESQDGVGSREDYCAQGADHTMCLYQGPSDSCARKTVLRALSYDAQQAIVDKHNELRRKVAKGEETNNLAWGNQPPASNMRKLVWNDELAVTAQRLADQCTFGHDKNRVKADGTSAGQNLYWSGSSQQNSFDELMQTVTDGVMEWYMEVEDPGYNSNDINPFQSPGGAGHYTQVVWAESEEIGCGFTYYKEDGWFNQLVFCNYAETGNFLDEAMYLQGEACSQCPNGYFCEDGLCAKN